ncbi:MAG TPA: antibiotic biosynthesis monooxygenase [Hellea balneolensis]|uniref:Antibiotic biosynthesis monooxygenase n=1 Tax=Hellea balneolensis TaxID=287478 RepID=A0A7C3GCK1_9PROT|nr:antibiotic biosynthesis monooxygenase [Hellea balneolensis]
MIAVIFELTPKPGQQEKYFNIAAALRPLLEKIEGFISVERFESVAQPGKFLSLSLFESEEAVLEWRNIKSHRTAQEKGRRDIFEHYHLRVAHITRDYTMTDRNHTPLDSRDHHDGT